MNGTVRKVLLVEGFGFVRGEDDVDRFFHRSAVVSGAFDLMEEGRTQVTFEHEDGKKGKGPRAVEIRIVQA